MIKKNITKNIDATIYVAEDGHEFETEYECEKYEKNISLCKKWESKKAGIITEEKTWNFYYIVSWTRDYV